MNSKRNIDIHILSRRVALTVFFATIMIYTAFCNGHAQTVPLGGGLNGVIDWNRDTPFVNLAKQSRGAYSLTRKDSNNNFLPATVGADGQPTEDFWLRVWDEGIPIPAGVYTITYKGVAGSQIDAGVSIGSLVDRGYRNGIRTYTFTAAAGASNVLEFNFRNTQGQVKNVQVLLPGYSTTAPPLFTKPFLNLLNSLAPTTLRFMDWHDTNDNMETTWAERSLPSDPAYNTFSAKTVLTEGGADGLGVQSVIQYDHGVPWEIAIQLANTTGKDLWINVPVLADDDYVTSLAKLIKYGDTINGVSYPGLKSGLHVYLEYANEVWNDSFSQCHVNRQAAVNEVVALSKSTGKLNGSDLNYDSQPLTTHKAWDGSLVYDGYVTWGDRRVARRIKQISDLFAKVWGAAAMNTIVRPMLPYQLSSYRFDIQLTYLNAVYGPPSKTLYGIAIAPYINAGNGQGLDTRTDLTGTDVLNALQNANDDFRYTPLLPGIAFQASYYGLKMCAYEAGPDTFGPNNIAAKKAATLSAPMQNIVQDFLNVWFTNGGDVLNWFTVGAGGFDSQYGTWSITDDLNNLNQPKELGYRAVRNGALPAITTGQPVPGEIDARATVDTAPPFLTSFYQKFIGPGSAFNYLVRAPKPAKYLLTVNIGNGDGVSELLQIWVNDSLVRTLKVPATTEGNFADTAPTTVTLASGLNGIRLVVPGNRPYDLNTLKVADSSGHGVPAESPRSNFYSFYESVPKGQTYSNLFDVSDSGTKASDIVVTAVADNPTLVPAANLSVQSGDFKDTWGGHHNRKLTFTPAVGNTGTVDLTLTLTNKAGRSRSVTTSRLSVTGGGADFEVDAPSSIAVHRNAASSAIPLAVSPGTGFTGTVTFSVNGLPKGVSATFSPNPATSNATVTFTASATAPLGPAVVNIVGVSGGVSHPYAVRLTVHR